MPTSVHIPGPLLEAVDRRARALRVSRNQLIVRALEREMKQAAEWSPGFFERLAEVDEATSKAADELLDAVRARRTAKGPPRL
jgi:chemotaxis regulatin CheY-phosphate phosphatase CheZ